MRALCVVLLLWTTAAAAQQRPIFDPDDFVDPRHRGGPFFISRLIAGGAANFADDYRPLDQSTRFIAIANAFYWGDFQVDYKYSAVRGEEDGAVVVDVCGVCTDGGQQFPTPPASDAIPAAPLPGSKHTVQFAWYRSTGNTALRYRLSGSRQDIETVVRSAASGQVLSRLSGHEQSIGVEADTLVRIGRRRLFGVVSFGRTARDGTADDRAQNELTYMHRFPAVSIRMLLLRGTVTIGNVSNRGGTAVNVVNPAFEAYWQERTTRANIHLIWSPQLLNSGAEGWTTNHQVAVFVDRHLFAYMMSKLPSSTASSRPVRKWRTESRTSGDGFSR